MLLVGIAGIFLLHRAFSEMRDATAIADSVLSESSVRKQNLSAHSADGATMQTSLLLLSQRVHRLLGTLSQEKLFLRDFMQDISHQLKTPLAVLQVNYDLLCGPRKLTKAQESEFLAVNQQQLAHMNWLITAQLKLARLDADVVTYRMEDASLYETCESARLQVLPLLKDQEIELRCDISRDIRLLHDRAWFCVAVCNLLKNALEHTTNGSICLSAEETPLSVQLHLTDTGSGMTQTQLAHLFDRFAVSNNEVNSRSTGIGMAIAQKIVHDTNGEISAESTPGGGTTLHLVFLKTGFLEKSKIKLDK